MLIFGINLVPHRLRTAWTRVFRYFLEWAFGKKPKLPANYTATQLLWQDVLAILPSYIGKHGRKRLGRKILSDRRVSRVEVAHAINYP